MNCPTCGAENEMGLRFCGECGAPLTEPEVEVTLSGQLFNEALTENEVTILSTPAQLLPHQLPTEISPTPLSHSPEFNEEHTPPSSGTPLPGSRDTLPEQQDAAPDMPPPPRPEPFLPTPPDPSAKPGTDNRRTMMIALCVIMAVLLLCCCCSVLLGGLLGSGALDELLRELSYSTTLSNSYHLAV